MRTKARQWIFAACFSFIFSSCAGKWSDLEWTSQRGPVKEIKIGLAVERSTFWKASDVTWIEVEWKWRNRTDQKFALNSDELILLYADGLGQNATRAYVPPLKPGEESKLMRTQYVVSKRDDLRTLSWAIKPKSADKPVLQTRLEPRESAFDLSKELNEDQSR